MQCMIWKQENAVAEVEVTLGITQSASSFGFFLKKTEIRMARLQSFFLEIGIVVCSDFYV